MKAALLLFFVALVAMQFFHPEKNISTEPPGRADLTVMHPPSAAVRDTLQRACYDCHSDHTRYPWYAEIQPIAWWLDWHVRDGKKHLNFSQFGGYDTKRQLHKLDELINEVEDGNMPLAPYKLTHAEARLTAAEVAALVAWAEDTQDQITNP